jgi:hypothetical protein
MQPFIAKIQQSINYLLSKISTLDKSVGNVDKKIDDTSLDLKHNEIYVRETIGYPRLNPASTGFQNVFYGQGESSTVPFCLNADVDITAISVYVTIASAGQAYFGVYQWDGNPGDTYTKIYQCPFTFNTGSTGIFKLTLPTPYTLKKGKLLACTLICEASGLAFNSVRLGAFGNGALGFLETMNDYRNYLTTMSANIVAGNMPDSISYVRGRNDTNGILPFVLYLKNK